MVLDTQGITYLRILSFSQWLLFTEVDNVQMNKPSAAITALNLDLSLPLSSG